MTQPTSIDEVVEEFEAKYRVEAMGEFSEQLIPNSCEKEPIKGWLRSKLTTLVEQARGEPSLLSFGYHKGEMDFGVNGTVTELTYEQMKELREMIVVGIGQLESMWRDSRPNLAARTISSDKK